MNSTELRELIQAITKDTTVKVSDFVIDDIKYGLIHNINIFIADSGNTKNLLMSEKLVEAETVADVIQNQKNHRIEVIELFKKAWNKNG
jgi:cytochrome oxidase Cu insertion factor (SCO1/SenC/PrrC family)